MIGGRAAPWIGLVLMGCPTPYEPPELHEVRPRVPEDLRVQDRFAVDSDDWDYELSLRPEPGTISATLELEQPEVTIALVACTALDEEDCDAFYTPRTNTLTLFNETEPGTLVVTYLVRAE